MTLTAPIKLLPNVRTAARDAKDGYTWGREARDSNILAGLGEYLRDDRASGTRSYLRQPGHWVDIAMDEAVAERWIVSDDVTYPSWPDQGKQSLRTILSAEPESMLGRAHVAKHGPFLRTVMKLIDTHPAVNRGSLSVQIHPPVGYPDRPAKPEMWRGTGHVYLGWARAVGRAELLEALALPRSHESSPEQGPLERLLNNIRLSKSYPLIVPGGTVHAIRAGSFLAEWSIAPGEQGLSRATVALYDRTDGKQPRPGKEDISESFRILDHSDGLAPSSRFLSQPMDLDDDGAGNRRTLLFRTGELFVEAWHLATGRRSKTEGRSVPLYVEAGEAVIRTATGEVRLTAGEEAFIPAAAGEFTVECVSPDPILLQTWHKPTDQDLHARSAQSSMRALPARLMMSSGSTPASFTPLLDETMLEQIARLRRGRIPIKLLRPCTLGDGILRLDQLDQDGLRAAYEQAVDAGRITKFVPASGAASRMFGDLTAVLIELDAGEPLTDSCRRTLQRLTEGLDRFAFANALRQTLNTPPDEPLADALVKDPLTVLRAILGPDGLGLARLPKGLVPFHRCGELSRTPLEAHFLEAADYTLDGNGIARLHFTVSDVARGQMETAIERARGIHLDQPGRHDIHFEVTCSIQEPATDTVSIDRRGEVVLDEDGLPLTRPGGHGALLHNLNQFQADIVSIKNIDNVVPDDARLATNRHKAVLGGLLLKMQSRIFGYLENLEDGQPTRDQLTQMLRFAGDELGAPVPLELVDAPGETIQTYLKSRFDRPLRVCGMVSNTGEPGGGPFWTDDPDQPLQIVESISVDLADCEQNDVWRSATHFNPVDIVCGLRNRHGVPYDLMRFRDDKAAMIGEKTLNDQPIRVLELPGLWNGGMARWNTVFVEVPATSFNPVKTVFDLLRSAHQAT